jgi:hypothetical protein
MASDVAGRRYGTWFPMLVRLYLRPSLAVWRRRCADISRPLPGAHCTKRRLYGLALWISFEASVVIVRDARAFVFVYVLFFGTGMVYAVIARKVAAWSYKAGLGVALVAGLALRWSNMVHVADSEDPVKTSALLVAVPRSAFPTSR